MDNVHIGKAFFSVDNQKQTITVKGSSGKYIVLSKDLKKYLLPPTRCITIPRKGLKGVETLEDSIESGLAQIPKGWVPLRGIDYTDLLVNCYLLSQIIKEPKTTIRNLTQHYEIIDMLVLFVPPNTKVPDFKCLPYHSAVPVFHGTSLKTHNPKKGGFYVIEGALTKNKIGSDKEPKNQKKLFGDYGGFDPTQLCYQVERGKEGIYFIENGYKTGKLTGNDFTNHPFVKIITKTHRNAVNIARFAEDLGLQLYAWLPDVNKLPKPRLCIVRIGAHDNNKFAIDPGHKAPYAETRIRYRLPRQLMRCQVIEDKHVKDRFNVFPHEVRTARRELQAWQRQFPTRKSKYNKMAGTLYRLTRAIREFQKP